MGRCHEPSEFLSKRTITPNQKPLFFFFFKKIDFFYLFINRFNMMRLAKEDLTSIDMRPSLPNSETADDKQQQKSQSIRTFLINL